MNDNFINLHLNTLNIIIGTPPPSEDLLRFRQCFEAVKFRQVINLSSTNLVQLCGFIRRIRKERASKKSFNYLILLHFTPQREVWHFLTRFRDLGVTIIMFGGVCSHNAINELFQFSPRVIMEWSEQIRVCGRAVICGYDLRTKQAGVFNTIQNIESMSVNINGELQKTLENWTDQRSPMNWTADTFTSMDTCRTSKNDNPFLRGDAKEQNSNRKRSYATATMNVNTACTILGITEQESHVQLVIKKAYRKKAMELHPDKHQDEEKKRVATNMFAQVSEARTYLDSLFN